MIAVARPVCQTAAMIATLQQIAEDLVKLKPGERVERAETWIGRVLDFKVAPTAAAWDRETDRRLDESKAGRAEASSAWESVGPARPVLREACRVSTRRR
jgi:hypothetical protein